MSNLAVSRRAVTRALAAFPVIAIPASVGANSRPTQLGDAPMNMHATVSARDLDGLSAWSEAVNGFRHAYLAQEAYYAFGPMAVANDRWDLFSLPLIERYGSIMAAKKVPELQREIETEYANLRAAEEAAGEYVLSLTEAEEILLRTPSPDLNALAYKIDVIKNSFEGMRVPDDIYPHIEADLRRLGWQR